MRYVALLRGINVGGKNKLDMKSLKEVFERVGMVSVKTYINSGNIIFSSDELSAKSLSATLEQAIYENFNLQIRVLVYNFEDYEKIALAVPENWTNDNQMKSDVLFLWEEINNESVLGQLVAKPEIDQINYVPGAILWAVDRQLVTKSGMMKVAGSELYKHMTVRNVNTVRKIYALMKDGKE
ncbi:DUF1697 domain-containing protein [Planococcus shenhongbingii]|uniref:DUF1697 domain-containing protein n=1 Tax=Planococcus shenhongbingii TaxID=3058398 RepID=A0ABT8NES5_9BACL|nr:MULTISPECIES: DUF1697 domain-containing protein [unclassified Planococcus (in: firmicutes)]MDN7246402.1 DUF1697 domain-containing protein [Planococcus sp. N017]WKA59394.1 DUF1697 domain-containing protein [Planococcus sp. N016]